MSGDFRNRLFDMLYKASPQHQPRPVLQRLRQMTRLDGLTPRQVRDRARQFQDAVIGTRRELQLVHGSLDECLTRLV